MSELTCDKICSAKNTGDCRYYRDPANVGMGGG